MPRLFSYCIPVDDGAAPNPFWGYCTLAICKPVIRRVAQEGDWIIGTGSRRAPGPDGSRDLSGHLVYAMRVKHKLPMEEYDAWARRHCPRKIPHWTARDHRHRLGDAIYDFRFNPPRLRDSVHDEGNRRRDLSGRYVLISDHFFYFGDNPVPLPRTLLPLARQTLGHRSRANAALLEPFLAWLGARGLKPKKLYGKPQVRVFDPSRSLCDRITAPCRTAGSFRKAREERCPKPMEKLADEVESLSDNRNRDSMDGMRNVPALGVEVEGNTPGGVSVRLHCRGPRRRVRRAR